MAKRELSQDISEIGNLLRNCKDDADVTKISSEIEKHTHKIKGLAPMMNQEKIGKIAALLDKLLKSVVDGKPSSGIQKTIRESYNFMQNTLDGKLADYESLQSEIEKNHNDLLQ